jgi:DNA-binding MarR family transcriptional regulator
MVTTELLSEEEAGAWGALTFLQTRLRTVLARGLARESGLSESDYEVLVHLFDAPDHRLRHFELGQRTAWEKSRLSHHLRRMSERSLVRTEGCPTDNRGTYIVLTDAGAEALAAAAPGHIRLVRSSVIDLLTSEELRVLRAIGDRIRAHLEGSCPSDGCEEECSDEA